MSVEGVARRHSKRIWFVVLGVFVGVFLFSFLVQKYKGDGEVDAASLAGFDPGYIISDYQMGNYNSMSEGDIQAFLTSKNSCGNRDYGYYTALSGNPNYRWHFENGHFICLSEERFGHNDNEIGFQYGESAAHIIWQAAQDYRINPQVLLVLLQKETGLITDPIPNNGDYRKATGYGCPDTAACSSQYYGFRNQVRNAAALFRTVLDGGWTNYPLGNNYIQYNPNAACGGSVVNVRSLATSALYRYTPYQPNAGALAAGYGTASCGAYGNRNFYLYFEDWFGGITREMGYVEMGTPRYMKLVRNAERINPLTYEVIDVLEAGRNIKFTTKTNTADGEMCLRSEYNTMNNTNACIRFSDLAEFSGLDYVPLATPRYFIVPAGTDIIDSRNGRLSKTTEDQKIFFDSKSYWTGGLCLRADYDTKNDIQACILYDALTEIGEISDMPYEEMGNPRVMTVANNTSYYDTSLGRRFGKTIEKGTKLLFAEKAVIDEQRICLRTMEDVKNNNKRCLMFDELVETINAAGTEYVPMGTKRSMRVARESDLVTTSGYYYKKSVNIDEGIYFVDKTYINGQMCLRSFDDQKDGIARCVMFENLKEAQELNFVEMGIPRFFGVSDRAVLVNLENGKTSTGKSTGDLYFVDKTYWNGKMCLREKSESTINGYNCYLYDTLDEK